MTEAINPTFQHPIQSSMHDLRRASKKQELRKNHGTGKKEIKIKQEYALGKPVRNTFRSSAFDSNVRSQQVTPLYFSIEYSLYLAITMERGIRHSRGWVTEFRWLMCDHAERLVGFCHKR